MNRTKTNTRILIKALIKSEGSRSAAAAVLNCSGSYIYAMESGKKTPGKYLFEKLLELVKNKGATMPKFAESKSEVIQKCLVPDHVEQCLQDVLDCFWDMSPLEYAQSRGLSYMSDEEGERVLDRARSALQHHQGD